MITFLTHSVSGQAKGEQTVHKSVRLSTICVRGGMVDTLALGASAFGCVGSSPTERTYWPGGGMGRRASLRC